LAELLEVHPPESGAVEVLGYIQIAHDDGHHIDPQQVDVLRLPVSTAARGDYETYDYEAPHVVFLNHRLRSLVAGLRNGETIR
jgi:hypothetical protein